MRVGSDEGLNMFMSAGTGNIVKASAVDIFPLMEQGLGYIDRLIDSVHASF